MRQNEYLWSKGLKETYKTGICEDNIKSVISFKFSIPVKFL